MHVRNAWKNTECPIPPGTFLARAEYFLRRNPWVVPVALGGTLLGLVALWPLGGKDER
jgi:hypothetical protein